MSPEERDPAYLWDMAEKVEQAIEATRALPGGGRLAELARFVGERRS